MGQGWQTFVRARAQIVYKFQRTHSNESTNQMQQLITGLLFVV
jgi:hypothetical protein